MPRNKKIDIVIESWNEGNGVVVATKRTMGEFEKCGEKLPVKPMVESLSCLEAGRA